MSTPIVRIPLASKPRVDQVQVDELRMRDEVRIRVLSFRTAVGTRRSRSITKELAEEPLNVPLAVATITALATLVPIALRQLRVIRSLPEPDRQIFDSDRVVTSRMAKPLGIPDSLLGLGSYGATLALVLLAPRYSLARKLVGPKLAIDTAVAGVNTVRQLAGFRKACSWCMLTVGATMAMAIAGRKHSRPAA